MHLVLRSSISPRKPTGSCRTPSSRQKNLPQRSYSQLRTNNRILYSSSKSNSCIGTRRGYSIRAGVAANEMQVINPANGATVATLTEDTPSTVKEKVTKARDAQTKWSTTTLDQRKTILTKFSDLLKERMEDLAKTLTSETGKPISQARNEIKATPQRVQFFIDNVEQAIKPRIARQKQGLSEEVRYEPLGTIANISAWNYPYFVGSNVFVPALLTGNAVLYKPSEHSSLTGVSIAKLLYEAGVPKDLFATVIGRGPVGEMLLAPENNVNGVFFTGSYATGKKIAEKVAGRMIPVQLELGGKDPTYVSNDVDVVKAAQSLADGAFYNCGQSCCSVERIYVHTAVYKQFVDTFVKEVEGFTKNMGDPTADSTYIGPLTLPHQVKILEAQVKDAVAKGATLVMGGVKGNQKTGNWFMPTVLLNVNHTMDVMKEESFGPIIGIQEVKSEEEAVTLMNDCKYGLTAGVYCNTKEQAERVMSKINSGTVYWNACDRVSPFVPWSGRGASGIGHTLGLEGIHAFVKTKSWHLVG